MSAPVFVVERAALLADDPVRVHGPEGHHAAVVRRLRVGEAVDLTDGAGVVVHGEVVAGDRHGVTVRVCERFEVPAQVPRLVVVQALVKGDRGELAVELMTEVGVDEVVPWRAERCVAVWQGSRADKALARWRTTARAAAKQSRRWWHPVVADPADSATVTERIRRAELAVVLHQAATQPLPSVAVPDRGEVLVVVGPEGGLTDDEVAGFADAGAQVVRLGPTVLRASTAGTAAAAVLLARTDRWGAP